MFDAITNHVRASWNDTLEGHGTFQEKTEVAVEGIAAGAAALALARFGITRIGELAEKSGLVASAGKSLLGEESAFTSTLTRPTSTTAAADGVKTVLPHIDTRDLSAAESVLTGALREQKLGTTKGIAGLLTKVTLTPEVNAGSDVVSNLAAVGHDVATVEPNLSADQVKSLFAETLLKVRAGDWSGVRPNAELLSKITDANTGDNVRASYWLSMAKGNLGEFEPALKGMQDVLERTSQWRSANGAAAIRQKFFEGYGKILRKAGQEPAAQVAEAHALGLKADIPDMAVFKEALTVPDEYVVSEQAHEAVNYFNYDQFYSEKFPHGFFDTGSVYDFSGKKPVITVIDPEHDPVIKALVAKVDENFGHLRTNPEASAAAIGEYTRRLFPQADEAAYMSWREENRGRRFYLGEFPRTGCGVCNQHSLVFKTLAESQGHDVTVLNGAYERIPHTFNTVKISGEDRLWDVSLNNVNQDFRQGERYESPFIDGTWDFNHEWDK